MEKDQFHPKNYWNQIYQNKTSSQLSWTEEKPDTSLEFFELLDIPKTARILDVGGGESKLPDFLLKSGFNHISVLDISAEALKRAQHRLGKDSSKISWIVGDITKIQLEDSFDVWHDRAAFHFLTKAEHIQHYLSVVKRVNPEFLIVGCFSKSGPEKCSGLPVTQYDENDLSSVFDFAYKKVKCVNTTHWTPSGKSQNFIFCGFKRKVNEV